MGAVGVACKLAGIVGRASQQYRSAVRALRHEDHGMKLDPIAHRNHHVAPRVVEAVVRRLELLGSFAWQRGILSLLIPGLWLSLLFLIIGLLIEAGDVRN